MSHLASPPGLRPVSTPATPWRGPPKPCSSARWGRRWQSRGSQRLRPRPNARPARTPGPAHGSPRSAASARRYSGSGRPPGHDAGNQTRTPAARRTTDSPGGGTPPHGRPSRRHRPSAHAAIRHLATKATGSSDASRRSTTRSGGRPSAKPRSHRCERASLTRSPSRRWPQATHRFGSLPAIGAKLGEEGSLTFKEDGKIVACPGQPGSGIVKEHGQTPGRDAQEVRPSTGPSNGLGAATSQRWLACARARHPSCARS